jgi:hypothetical protein
VLLPLEPHCGLLQYRAFEIAWFPPSVFIVDDGH